MVLINLMRDQMPAHTAVIGAGLSLLQAGLQMFNVSSILVGKCQPLDIEPDQAAMDLITQLEVNAFSIWRDRRFTDGLASAQASVLFFGGSWLEEEIFISALQAAERGYDVRLVSDITTARAEADRSFVLDRLALHGILATTVRQMLLEWAVCLGDPVLLQKVQELLS
ncbi:isochorismatase family protein [Bradyrhizobium sp. ARR65]|uniref:isochorismatase family protein n=1 Tax=Bradyrhizobium sp. ARR65 TaxID=1040989 RepID=UPI0004630107|nr:isochorismatase family protein [Bradyrhizobium sp. ARR65]